MKSDEKISRELMGTAALFYTFLMSNLKTLLAILLILGEYLQLTINIANISRVSKFTKK